MTIQSFFECGRGTFRIVWRRLVGGTVSRAVQRDLSQPPQRSTGVPRAVAKISLVMTMDRIVLTFVASLVLLFLSATTLYVPRTADLLFHDRTVGVGGRVR
jgi:hypothetical protein